MSEATVHRWLARAVAEGFLKEKERMRGHIRKRGSKWAVVVDVGYDENGKRRQRWHSGFARQKDAERALTEILGRLESGTYVEPAKLTYAEYLRARWLPAREPSLRPITYDGYARNVERHIIPALGAVRLQQLTPDALTAFYADRLRAIGRNGKPLSARTVRYLHSIVHKSLADALRWGLVVRNVADAAEPPSYSASKAPPPKTWNAGELRAFLGHVTEDRLYALWLVYATTGLRRGEALGLDWPAVDLEAAMLSIRAEHVTVRGKIERTEPKSARGLRAVALGPAYTDCGLVFCREDGSPLDPNWVSARFSALVAELDVPRVTLRGLRHTWASLALSAGVNPKIVSERLGHATVAFTLDTYSHVMPGMQEDAAAKVAALLERLAERRVCNPFAVRPARLWPRNRSRAADTA